MPENGYETDKKGKPSEKIIRRTLKLMLSTAWKEKKSIFLVYLVRFIVSALGELKVLLLPKLLVDELVLIKSGADFSDHLKTIIIYVALTVGADILSRLVGTLTNALMSYYSTWFDMHFSYMMADKSMEMDFQYTEDPDALDQQNKAKEGMSWYSGGLTGILDILCSGIYNIILLGTSVAIIAVYCPLLIPVQVLAMGTVCWFEVKNNRIDAASFLKLAKANRIFGYMFYNLTSFEYGKDIRMYDSTDMMIERQKLYSDEQIGIWHEQSNAKYINYYGSNVANALRDGISYLYMGLRALAGIITLGEFTMCVSAASRLYQSLMGLGRNFTDIQKNCNYAFQFVRFLEYPDALEKGNEHIKGTSHEIEFKDVSFKYPRAEEYVLEHVNLKIRSGEHLSIVGLNGAGKTTFIKLLCRLYDVTDGAILIDGTDIRDYSEEEYRKLFAVVFQDFKLFAFSLKDNIAMGDPDHEPDISKLENSLKLSGLYDDAVKLDRGFDTLLYKSFDEHGTELSGGQEQKAAISRALYKDAPVVILDEPTAALDPIAEYEIYKKFDTLVHNKSAIYISHRLSSCKFCDRIAVFADKTVKEYGTHSELIKLEGGIYAEMFNTQAQYYVNAVSENA